MRPVTINGMFGWLHPVRQGVGRDVAVLICSGLNRDALDSHHYLRMLADDFATAGYSAMRFSYPETADSCDVADTALMGTELWAAWQQSVNAAADWLRTSTGAKRLIFCGLRIGATLAALAGEHRDDVAGLILLAPVLRGHSYMRQLWIEAGLQGGSRGPMSEGFEFEELRFGRETVSCIGKVELRELKMPSGRQVAIYAQSKSDLLATCVRNWVLQGAQVSCAGFDGFEPLLNRNLGSSPALAGFAGLIEWVTQVIPSQYHPFQIVSGLGYPVLRSPGWIETPLSFGPSNRLFGMLCRSDQQFTETAIVICGAGNAPQYGVGRCGAKFARLLAQNGTASLRIDFGGVGDSIGSAGRENGSTNYYENRTFDISAAIDTLQRLGYRRFAVQGVCSGAYQGLHAALTDLRIEALLLVNLPMFTVQAGETPKLALRTLRRMLPFSYYLKRLNSKRLLAKLMRGQVQFGGIVAAQFEKLLERFKNVFDARGPTAQSGSVNFARSALRTLSQRQVKTLFLFGGNEIGVSVIEQSFGTNGEGLCDFEGVSLRFAPELHHLLNDRRSQQIAADHMIDLLASRPNAVPS